MRRSVSGACIGVAFALRAHLHNVPRALDGGPLFPQALLAALLPNVLDERHAPLSGGDNRWWLYPEEPPEAGVLFETVYRLVAAFDLRDHPEVLVQALMLVERLLRNATTVAANVLTASNIRPLLLAAVSISSKMCFDEHLIGVVDALRAVGFRRIDSDHLCDLEVALLRALQWRAFIHDESYGLYELEVHKLARSLRNALEVLCPTMLEAAASLEPPPAVASLESPPLAEDTVSTLP